MLVRIEGKTVGSIVGSAMVGIEVTLIVGSDTIGIETLSETLSDRRLETTGGVMQLPAVHVVPREQMW